MQAKFCGLWNFFLPLRLPICLLCTYPPRLNAVTACFAARYSLYILFRNCPLRRRRRFPADRCKTRCSG